MSDVDDRAAFEASLRTRLHDIYSARPWLACSEIDQGALRMAARLRDAGAAEVMAFGASPGIGPIDRSIPIVSLDQPRGPVMMDNIRAAAAGLAAPPPEVQAVIDRWDPPRRAAATPSLHGVSRRFGDRPVFGARRPEWAALDDKLTIGPVWTAAGLDVAPSELVELGNPSGTAMIDAALAAHRRLASARGTVWAVDNTNGWHGGATGTHWVPGEDRVADTVAELATAHRQVRIMPFLDGIPCSIHGLVTGTATIVFRPCEMVVFRHRSEAGFHYGRAGTFWDPTPADRSAMRRAARRLGDELRRQVGYRGVFTLDGVMTAEGFRPTEVNPRFGAALPSDLDALDGPPLSLYLIHLAVIEGELDDLDHDRLERWAVANMDEHRRAAAMITTASRPPVERSGVVLEVDGRFVVAEGEGDDVETGAVATFDWGDGNEGEGLLALNLVVEATPVGPPVAARVLRVAEAIDDALAVDLPELEAASPAR